MSSLRKQKHPRKERPINPSGVGLSLFAKLISPESKLVLRKILSLYAVSSRSGGGCARERIERRSSSSSGSLSSTVARGGGAQLAVEVLTVAGKFKLPRLQAECERKIAASIRPDNVSTLLRAADEAAAQSLRAVGKAFLVRNFKQARRAPVPTRQRRGSHADARYRRPLHARRGAAARAPRPAGRRRPSSRQRGRPLCAAPASAARVAATAGDSSTRRLLNSTPPS